MDNTKKRRRSDDSVSQKSTKSKQSLSSQRSSFKSSVQRSSLDSLGTLDTCTSAADQNVRVVVRLRPLSDKERRENSKESISVDNEACSIVVDKNRRFEYDAVFGPQCTQQHLYNVTVADMIQQNVMKGFNVTILAYGQTGSGKTFTMGTNAGTSEEFSTSPSEGDGVIPRAVYDLFQLKTQFEERGQQVKVEMSYKEIYNEELRDLLNTSSSGSNLFIRDGKDGVVVQNLTLVDVSCPREVSEIMASASDRRATASTAMNAVSSRSHAICTLHVSVVPSMDGDRSLDTSIDEEIRSKLTLVDLAGSERIKRTCAEGKRMKEGININKGLFVLGQVVSSLSDANGSSHANIHIPYRDSKLTRLLQDSLGGNSRTLMIACVSPADSNIEESTNTLRYAQRTRNIKNSAIKNVVSNSMSVEVARLRRENQTLKLELERVKSMSTPLQPGTSVSGMEELPDSKGTGGVNVEKLDCATRSRAKILSLQQKNDILEERLSTAADDVLRASTQADTWQLKYNQLLEHAKTQGVESPDLKGIQVERQDIVDKLRDEVTALKSKLDAAVIDAAVARATATAVVLGDGNLTAVEEMELSNESAPNDEDPEEDDMKEQLRAELVSMQDQIEQKETIAIQMAKERQCMDTLRAHFETSIQRLQEEVEEARREKEVLLEKARRKPDSKSSTRTLRDPRIKKLEERIASLTKKAEEHRKTLRMKESTERKCAKLAAEIQEDKRRRVTLQRKLREISQERREEKKVAQQKAARMLRDSQKLQHELNKLRQAADKQAAVLRRKAAEAVSRKKRAAEQERKRQQASSRTVKTQQKDECLRKNELTNWFEQQTDSAGVVVETRTQTEKLREILEQLVEQRDDLAVNEPHGNDALAVVTKEIQSHETEIKQLEASMESIVEGSSRLDALPSLALRVGATWNSLSRVDCKFLLSYAFEQVLQSRSALDACKANSSQTVAREVSNAVAEQKRIACDEISKLKIEHSEQTMALLESTKSAVCTQILADANEANAESPLRCMINKVMGTYLQGCDQIGESVREQLKEVRSQQGDMKTMFDEVAQEMFSGTKRAGKPKKKLPKPARKSFSAEEYIFEDDDEMVAEDSDDSDWNPETPAKRQRKTKQMSGRVSTDSDNPDGVQQMSHKAAPTIPPTLDSMKVSALRQMLRQRGLAVSGKKAELVKRLRDTIESTEEESEDCIVLGENTDASKEDETPLDANEHPNITISKENETPLDGAPMTETAGEKSFEQMDRLPLLPKSFVAADNAPKKGGGGTKIVGGPERDKEDEGPPLMRFTASAKKRRKRDMANALNSATLEFQKIR